MEPKNPTSQNSHQKLLILLKVPEILAEHLSTVIGVFEPTTYAYAPERQMGVPDHAGTRAWDLSSHTPSACPCNKRKKLSLLFTRHLNFTPSNAGNGCFIAFEPVGVSEIA